MQLTFRYMVNAPPIAMGNPATTELDATIVTPFPAVSLTGLLNEAALRQKKAINSV